MAKNYNDQDFVILKSISTSTEIGYGLSVTQMAVFFSIIIVFLWMKMFFLGFIVGIGAVGFLWWLENTKPKGYLVHYFYHLGYYNPKSILPGSKITKRYFE